MPKRKTDQRKLEFLRCIRLGAPVSHAAEVAGVHRSSPYTWAKADPAFAQDWRQARQRGYPGSAVDRDYELALSGHVPTLIRLITQFDHPSSRLKN